MTDYGNSTYSPANNIYSGLVGKIAKQVIEGETIKSEFGSLFKEPMKNGKDLEVALYKAATGVEYNRTTPPTAGSPASDVLYFTEQERKTYPVKIDQKEIDEGATDGAAAERIAQEIVATLYSGAFKDENENIFKIFSMVNQNANPPQVVFGDTLSFLDVTNETDAKALLKVIKDTAKKVRKGSTAVNPRGNRVNAPRVCLLIPISAHDGVDVYARMGAYNREFDAYGVDDIFEYDPSAYGLDDADSLGVYVFDDRYVQARKVHPDSYKEHPVAGCDNVDAYLHRYIMYAACPLFNCVKITLQKPADTTE